MTVAMLMQNTVQSALRAVRIMMDTQWHLKSLALNIQSKVPSDIVIARSQEPKNISILAEEIGLYTNEISMYGSKKGKVSLSVLNRLKDHDDGKYVVVAG